MYLSCLRVAHLFNQQPIYCTVSVNTVDQSWTGTSVNSQFERHFLPVAFDFSCKQVHLRCSWIKHVWSSDCSCCFLPCLTAFFVAARSFVIVAVNCEGIPTWCDLFFPYMTLRHPSLCLASCNRLISLVSFSLCRPPTDNLALSAVLPIYHTNPVPSAGFCCGRRLTNVKPAKMGKKKKTLSDVRASFTENSIKPQVSGRLMAAIIHTWLKVVRLLLMPVYECVCVGEEVDYVASPETKFLGIIKHSEKWGENLSRLKGGRSTQHYIGGFSLAPIASNLLNTGELFLLPALCKIIDNEIKWRWARVRGGLWRMWRLRADGR